MDPLFRGLANWLMKPGNAQMTAHVAQSLYRDHQQNRESRAAGSGAAVAARAFSLAVLGEPEAGKTTLINSWREADLSESPGRTQAPERYGHIVKRTKAGVLTFKEVIDVGGHESSLPHWDKLVEQGRWVLYLINANRLYAPEGWTEKERYRLDEHADRISHIIREREKDAKIPQVGIIVVVTHTDQDPRWSEEPTAANRYEDEVREQLYRVIMLLGGDSRVRLVCGSLVDQARADQLTDRIAEHLLKWAP
jgi:GTPase SAR1 family protein